MQKTELPPPSPEAQAASDTLLNLIRNTIEQAGGWIPFSRFMELALYTPQYGYYTGGSHKIGSDGDFITAPVLSPLFARCLATQLEELLPQTAGNIYEFGAGTGALAAGLLEHIRTDLLKNYYIIEISPELAARQQQHIRQQIPAVAEKVIHLTELPNKFDGIIIGNEVLDAMPVEIVQNTADGLKHMGVGWQDGLQWQPRKLSDDALSASALNYLPPLIHYTSELHPTQHAFIRTLAEKLQRGGIIMIDYGFDAGQYYHPQRSQGTLIGHYRHHTVHDPFYLVGLTDLTAHVNFTDIAQAGTDGSLDLIGYLPQSRFLLNLDITDKLQTTGTPDSPEYIRETANLHILIGQHEMGELFKVIAFGRNIDPDWRGFRFGDICHKL
ncbi:MAG: SAM-dependent methyltransferase [Neisseria sp.]|nr:SAM-dependent methyltransferase [Neisseria sp.]